MLRSRVAFVVLALSALVAAGCGSSGVSAPPDPVAKLVDEPSVTAAPVTGSGSADPGSDAEASPAGPVAPAVSKETRRVRRSAGKTDGDTYRAEIFMQMRMGGNGMVLEMGSADEPIATAASDGRADLLAMDMGILLGDLFTSLEGFGTEELGFDPENLVMESIVTADHTYLRAPMLSAATTGASGPSPFDWMQAAAEGWVRFGNDAITTDLGLEAFGEVTGNETTAGPQAYLDLLEEVADVEPLGSATVRGREVEQYRATTSLAEAMALQGADLEDMIGDVDLAALFADVEYRFDVSLDGKGRVVAVDARFDESFLGPALEASGDQAPDQMVFEVGMRIEFFDHGADIAVPLPDAVDITEDFLETLGPDYDLATVGQPIS